jgi:hypothetical protein
METQTPLWDGDTGDMDATTRDALAALVTLPFVTDFDHVRQSSDSLLKVIEQDERTFGLIRRDLDNLGRELVIDTKLRVAFARQRDDVDAARIRRTAWRRTVREGTSRGLLDADILYMAIKLRQHLDETLARNEAIARMTTDELYAAFSGSPSATKLDGDAEAVRRHLIEKYSTGTIVLSGLIRLAFSTIPAKKLADVFANVDAAVRDLKAARPK